MLACNVLCVLCVAISGCSLYAMSFAIPNPTVCIIHCFNSYSLRFLQCIICRHLKKAHARHTLFPHLHHHQHLPKSIASCQRPPRGLPRDSQSQCKGECRPKCVANAQNVEIAEMQRTVYLHYCCTCFVLGLLLRLHYCLRVVVCTLLHLFRVGMVFCIFHVPWPAAWEAPGTPWRACNPNRGRFWRVCGFATLAGTDMSDGAPETIKSREIWLQALSPRIRL